MIVCVCHRISDRDIARQVRAGLSFDDIQLELGVATQCGRCEGCARDVVQQCSVGHPIAALHSAVERDDRGLDAPVNKAAGPVVDSSAWNCSYSAAA